MRLKKNWKFNNGIRFFFMIETERFADKDQIIPSKLLLL